MPVANGMPLAAIGAGEEVPPCCVTVISAYACRQVAPAAETVMKATDRCVWTQRTPPIWSHSPQCAECDHVGGRPWVVRVRRRASLQFCGIERGRFRRMPDGDRRTRRETSTRALNRAYLLKAHWILTSVHCTVNLSPIAIPTALPDPGHT